jgi:hypothetical protein
MEAAFRRINIKFVHMYSSTLIQIVDRNIILVVQQAKINMDSLVEYDVARH